METGTDQGRRLERLGVVGGQANGQLATPANSSDRMGDLLVVFVRPER